jgi:hypothetical protein
MARRMSAPYDEMSLAGAIRAALWEGLAVLEAKFPPVPLKDGPRPHAPARRAPAARKKPKR